MRLAANMRIPSSAAFGQPWLHPPQAKDGRLRAVQLEGHVILKIVKHCQECAPNLVTGQLLGLDVGSTLEVTDSFPFPVSNLRRQIQHQIPFPLVRSSCMLWPFARASKSSLHVGAHWRSQTRFCPW